MGKPLHIQQVASSYTASTNQGKHSVAMLILSRQRL